MHDMRGVAFSGMDTRTHDNVLFVLVHWHSFITKEFTLVDGHRCALLGFEILDLTCHSYAGNPYSAQALAELIFAHNAGDVGNLEKTS